MSELTPDYAVGDVVEIQQIRLKDGWQDRYWDRAVVKAVYTHQVSVRLDGAENDLAVGRKHVRRPGSSQEG